MPIVDLFSKGRRGAVLPRPQMRQVATLDGVRRCALLVLLALSATAASAAEPLVIALSRTPLSLPFYIAESQGYFQAQKLQVSLDEVQGGHRAMQRLLDGKADLATSSEAVVMFASLKRKDFAVLASFVSSKTDVQVIVRGDSGIARVSDLAGKRVGIISGSASDYYLNLLLLYYGVDSQQVKFADIAPEEMAAALARGNDLDAISVWQPYAYRALQGVKGVRALEDDGIYTLRFNLSVSRKLVQTRGDDLVDLMRALVRAQAFIAAEPQRAQAMLRQRLDMDQPYIDWLWTHYRFRMALEQSLITTLESEARWALRENHVAAQNIPDYLDYIESVPLRRVQPSAVRILE